MAPESSTRGFTLIEVLVGIAAASILLVSVFQFAGKILTFRRSLYSEGISNHRVVTLHQLLHDDLTSIPRGEMMFDARRDRFTRRAVNYNSDEGYLMEARVRYVIRQEEGQERLYRQWYWTELQDRYEQEDLLVSADRVKITYQLEPGRWSTRPGDARPSAVRIQWGEADIVSPLADDERER